MAEAAPPWRRAGSEAGVFGGLKACVKFATIGIATASAAPDTPTARTVQLNRRHLSKAGFGMIVASAFTVWSVSGALCL